MSILDYDSIVLLNGKDPKNEIDFQKSYFQLVVLTFFFFLCYFGLPSLAVASEKLKERTSQKLVEAISNPNNNPFTEGISSQRNGYTVVDYRSSSIKRKTLKKALKAAKKEVIESNIDSLKKLPGTITNLNFGLPVIDLNFLFQKKAMEVNPIVEQIIETALVENVSKPSNNMLFLRGGIIGYLLGKVAKDKEREKEKDVILTPFVNLFSNNPMVYMALTSALYIFCKKSTGAQTPPLAKALSGEKKVLGFKDYLWRVISPSQPYLYVIIILAFLVTYRATLNKLFRKEMSVGEAFNEIVNSFLHTNADLYKQMNEITQKMVQYMMATEGQSDTQAVPNENKSMKLVEDTIEELNTNLYEKKEKLETIKEILPTLIDSTVVEYEKQELETLKEILHTDVLEKMLEKATEHLRIDSSIQHNSGFEIRKARLAHRDALLQLQDKVTKDLNELLQKKADNSLSFEEMIQYEVSSHLNEVVQNELLQKKADN